MDLFISANKINSAKSLRKLLVIEYFIQTRGHCFEYDVAYSFKNKNNYVTLKYTSIAIARIKMQGLLRYVKPKVNKDLGRCLEITDLGYSVLDNYRAFFNRVEKELMYELKQVHSKATPK